MKIKEAESLVTISGKVQTVGFRDFVKRHADELMLRGYVQNQENGNVEVLVQGEKDQILILVDHLWKGPVFSEVANVSIEWHSHLQDPFEEFEIWN